MDVIETFERGKELGRESRTLPAKDYNLIRILLSKSTRNCLFVPIRSMQYMAVIDDEEIIFVDSMNKRFIQQSWTLFKPQVRETLTDAVPYTLIYYSPNVLENMKRLQSEFSKALKHLEKKFPIQSDGYNVINLSDK